MPKCDARKDCPGAGVWRPVLRFYAPAPHDGSFTMEMSLSVCPACRSALRLGDFLSEDIAEIAAATVVRMGRVAPDPSRTSLEWIPSAEAVELPPARRDRGLGGLVARHILLSVDPVVIESARKTFGENLEVLAPDGLDLADLAGKMGTMAAPPPYCCASCGGKFKQPIIGGSEVAILVFCVEEDAAKYLVLHARCLSPRRCTSRPGNFPT